ncbi:hypothetical protein Lal_00012094 [Lupinus albus]|uniref:Putative Zf-FLZ domain-containing protein n=1 Tax=Lupinus albus TaxID=3870 RepID=A0A6A4QBP8_LUPAL|nr:putative Zf-FLZ domain-containing protein [Lupinus albus]KAF1877321.1 hypothetical protein Lal_00012094 [Lupinus albus]
MATNASSSRSSIFYYVVNEEPHFLEACFLCTKSLGQNNDIYMYRGNTPFCSKECRGEQIEIDEAKEKSCKHSSKRNSNKTSRTGIVVVS